ncbi:hydroxymethylglutaryl-CoA lyase, partial [Acinetobacter baumannii]
VMADARRFAALGVDIVTLGDTTGMATPASVRDLYGRMAREVPQVTPVAHFHDTRGTGLVNYVAALEAGVTHFDCAFGGVGGHPAKV